MSSKVIKIKISCSSFDSISTHCSLTNLVKFKSIEYFILKFYDQIVMKCLKLNLHLSATSATGASAATASADATAAADERETLTVSLSQLTLSVRLCDYEDCRKVAYCSKY